MTQAEAAKLFGVAESTIYRWGCLPPGSALVDPASRRLRVVFSALHPRDVERVREVLLTRGGLRGVYEMLKLYYER